MGSPFALFAFRTLAGLFCLRTPYSEGGAVAGVAKFEGDACLCSRRARTGLNSRKTPVLEGFQHQGEDFCVDLPHGAAICGDHLDIGAGHLLPIKAIPSTTSIWRE
jgi:hypothetical protein